MYVTMTDRYCGMWFKWEGAIRKYKMVACEKWINDYALTSNCQYFNNTRDESELLIITFLWWWPNNHWFILSLSIDLQVIITNRTFSHKRIYFERSSNILTEVSITWLIGMSLIAFAGEVHKELF